ncbi:MAG TPA: hypothetical protein VN807_04885, partial [Candidatus Sulfotelmatobacter sp.]|nr:hypothetical protein [Candidatus Sulfotelmatobacter sp.]
MGRIGGCSTECCERLGIGMRAGLRAFTERYISRTGTLPGYGAFQIHDAVRMIAASLRSAGTNRVLLRDSLASGAKFHGLAGIYSFDSAGNLTQGFAIVQI